MAVSSRLASRKRIGVIGDSHSLFCFCEVAEASIFWRGPISMHRVGRDGLLSVLPPKCRLSDYDALVIVFGEIDCRAHVPNIATRKGLSLDAVIEDLAVRYVAAIAAVRGGFSGPIGGASDCVATTVFCSPSMSRSRRATMKCWCVGAYVCSATCVP